MSLKQYYMVLDFEANCSGSDKRDHEIIEFPCVLVDSTTGETISEFRHFVKCITHKKLSKFIKDLTHITDEQVNKGLEWKVCLYEFEKWCLSNAITHENTTVITCGDWDLQIMLPRQLQLSKTKLTPYLRTILCAWTDIKVYYKHQTKSKSRGMAGMLEYLKIELTGHHHSGIDDCRNIAKICNYLIGQGSIITNTTCHNPKN